MVDSTLQEDLDPLETREWQDALSAVIAEEGEDRAHFILETLIDQARRSGTYIPYRSTTAYLNTIPVAHEQRSPGDASLEWRIRSFVRWNALAMVMRANRESSELGGHIASFASAATLYDVGFNHFWRGRRSRARRRPCILSGSFCSRDLCASVSGGTINRKTARRLSPGN